MSRLVVKIKYMKPASGRTMGRYAKYIGTREGVVKIDDSHKKDQKTYADYIATRPRAERNGKHGLFTDDGVEVNLEEVSRELNAFEGTIWTAIVSLQREDAQRLGFDTGAQWRTILRAHRDEIAGFMKIAPKDYKWYAAFHDEGHHPHIHMILYDKENRGYLSKEGVEGIKNMFAHAIFQDEMFLIEREKSNRRDQLRLRGKEEIDALIDQIHNGASDNVILQAMILDLSRRLREHKGRKKYSYLKQADKRLVDSIVDELEKIPAVKELYDIWYEKQEALSSIYRTTIPERVPLSLNPVFKTLRNHVIEVASDLGMDERDDAEELEYKETLDIAAKDKTPFSPTQKNLSTKESQSSFRLDSGRLALVITRLLNHAVRIFQDQFMDNPSHSAKVDRKVWMKIREKEEAHGIKMG